jgi:hypothetical protein
VSTASSIAKAFVCASVLGALLAACGPTSAYLFVTEVDLSQSRLLVSPPLRFAGSHAVCLIFEHADFAKLTAADFAEFRKTNAVVVDSATQLRVVPLRNTEGFDTPRDAKYIFAIVGEGRGSLRVDFSPVRAKIEKFKIAIVKDPLQLKSPRTRWEVQ